MIPRVTVVTIFLDPGPFFREALDSVMGQTFVDLEYVLVDDGSTDGSTELARELAASDPQRVRYVDHDGHANLGMSRSRNVGIALARGDRVAFLDADDVWLPDAIERQMAHLDAEPSAQMVIGATLLWRSWAPEGGRDRVRALDCRGLVGPPRLALERIRQRTVSPSMNTLLARRSAIEAVGGFEDAFTGLFEDQAFLLKFLLAHVVMVHDEVVDHYRQHPASAVARVATDATTQPDVARRNDRAFARFAHRHVVAGRWRWTRVHLEAAVFHRLPTLGHLLYRFRPGLRGRIVATAGQFRERGRGRRR